MNKKYIDINNEVNHLLQAGLAFALSLEKRGEKELAGQVLATTSKLAYKEMVQTGLSKELKKFWNDKQSLATNYN